MKTDNNRTLEYAVNDVPPAGHLFVLSLQHVMLMFVSVALPIIFTSQIGESNEFAARLVSLSMIAAGIGSIIQSVGLPFIGSGYLCPNVCGPSYFSLSLSAAWMGGMPLMRGMIIVAGLVEMALAPVVQKLKSVFPRFIVGLVVAMVGISIINMAVNSLFGIEYKDDAVRSPDIVIGMVSLMIMVLCNIWGKGWVKVYCLLIGMVAGWIFACVLQPEYFYLLTVLDEKPLLAVPAIGTDLFNVSVDMSLMVPFVIISISGSLKSFGNLLAAQKISEPDRETVDFVPIKKGLLADGFSTVLSGVLGGMAVDTSSSNVGLAGSTKVLSRWLSVVAGILFIILAFCPKLTVALTLMPKPVLGASFIFAGCYMICTGFLELFKDEWDQRKTFVVGIALMFGLSTAFLPDLYARTPHLVKIFFTDPLPTTTILAVILHQVLNLDKRFADLTGSRGTG